MSQGCHQELIPRIFGPLVGLFVGAGGGVLKFRDRGGRGKGGRGKGGEKPERRRERKKARGGKKRRVRSPRWAKAGAK